MDFHSTPKRDKIIQFNEEVVKDHLGEMVRSTVEETLNQMLEAEADRLCNAEKYKRAEARQDTRAGHYQRKLQIKAGEVSLNMPKLRRQTFETALSSVTGVEKRPVSIQSEKYHRTITRPAPACSTRDPGSGIFTSDAEMGPYFVF